MACSAVGYMFCSKFLLILVWGNASTGTGGRGDTRHTCGTTAAAGKVKAAKAAKVHNTFDHAYFVQETCKNTHKF